MDVIRPTLFLLFISQFFVGCFGSVDQNADQPNTNTSNKPTAVIEGCPDQAIPNEYLVKRENGSIELVHGSSVEDVTNQANTVSLWTNNHPVIIEPHYKIKVAPFIENSENPNSNSDSNNSSRDPKTFQWGLDTIQVESAWDENYRGDSIIVAVIDSGLDLSHPFFQNQLAINENESINGEDDDDNGYIDDVSGYDFVKRSGEMVDRTGHGTHVSGIIAAKNTDSEFMGVAPNAKILPLNFIDEDERGSIVYAIEAIRYAVDQGANIINASWGGPSCSKALLDEIAGLESKNIIFVSAAGNSGSDLSRFPEFPAAFDFNHHISVGASTLSGNTAGFSNFGGPVHLVAPGNHIISTFPARFADGSEEDDLFKALQGTSMAAPFVAGAAALLMSAAPNAEVRHIVDSILKGVEPGPFPVQSRGQLNLKRALNQLFEGQGTIETQ